MFDTCRRQKELAKEMLCVLAGLSVALGRKSVTWSRVNTIMVTLLPSLLALRYWFCNTRTIWSRLWAFRKEKKTQQLLTAFTRHTTCGGKDMKKWSLSVIWVSDSNLIQEPELLPSFNVLQISWNAINNWQSMLA